MRHLRFQLLQDLLIIKSMNRSTAIQWFKTWAPRKNNRYHQLVILLLHHKSQVMKETNENPFVMNKGNRQKHLEQNWLVLKEDCSFNKEKEMWLQIKLEVLNNHRMDQSAASWNIKLGLIEFNHLRKSYRGKDQWL